MNAGDHAEGGSIGVDAQWHRGGKEVSCRAGCLSRFVGEVSIFEAEHGNLCTEKSGGQGEGGSRGGGSSGDEEWLPGQGNASGSEDEGSVPKPKAKRTLVAERVAAEKAAKKAKKAEDKKKAGEAKKAAAMKDKKPSKKSISDTNKAHQQTQEVSAEFKDKEVPQLRGQRRVGRPSKAKPSVAEARLSPM